MASECVNPNPTDPVAPVEYTQMTMSYVVPDPDPGSEVSYTGVCLTNGKTGIVTSDVYNKCKSSFITTRYDMDEISTHKSNVLESWCFSGIEYGTNSGTDFTIDDYNQSFDMYRAVFTKEYTLICTNTSSVLYNMGVSHEMVSLQQYPYCFLNSYNFTPGTPGTPAVFTFNHIVENMAGFEDVKYTNNLIDGVRLFSSEGYDPKRNIRVVSMSTYSYSSGISLVNKGYNLKNNIAYNKFEITCVSGGEPSTVYILSATMTSNDFKNPKQELTRILLTIIKNTSMTEVTEEHYRRWDNIWKSDIKFDESLARGHTDHLNKIQMNIRYCLYNIYSSVRDDVSVESNPLNISAIDTYGDVFWNGDLFLIPVLIILRPPCAKMLLEHRFSQLQTAKSIASTYGFKGSKYPYENDVYGYNDIFWNSSSSLHVFNTSLICFNAWNYYRATRDVEWLRTKAVKILANSADFFTSLLDEKGSIQNTISMNNLKGKNNVMTIYFACTTVKIAIEAYYEISYKVKEEWYETYKTLSNKLTKIVNETGPETTLNLFEEFVEGTTLRIAEVLLIFTSYHSKLMHTLIPVPKMTDFIRRHIDYFESILESILETENELLINKILFTSIWGQLSQISSSEKQCEDLHKFETSLESIFDISKQPWGGTRYDAGVIFAILTGLCVFRFTGSINFRKFYVERFGLISKTGYYLPTYIEKITVTRGIGNVSFSIQNTNPPQ